jgi:hypothetical protein
MFRSLDLSASLFGSSCFVVWILMFRCLDLNVSSAKLEKTVTISASINSLNLQFHISLL